MEEKGNKAIIIYTNDNGEKRTDYATILEESDSTIKFQTENGPPIKLPWHRVLKVKYKEEKPYKPFKEGNE